MNKDKLINWALFLLLSLIWGSSFILMKEGSKALTGAQIATVRIFSAGLVFLPFALFHFASIPKNKLALLIVSAIVGNLLPAFLFATAINHQVESSLAGILNSLTPLLVIILGVLFFKSQISLRKVTGVLVGFIGLLLLSLSKGGITLTTIRPALLIFIATLCYGLNVNLVAVYLKGIDPFKMATVSLAFMLVPTSILINQQDMLTLYTIQPSARWPIGAVVILGVLGTAVATGFFYALIKRAGGLFASLVTYGIPIVAMLWGLWANENVTLVQVACLALILGGVYLANRAK